MRAAACLLLLLLAPPAFAARPRLMVVVVADQMPIRLWDRVLPALPPGGLRRLVEGGTMLVGRYGHAMTGTGPGHALLATGADAARSGIVANEWFTRVPFRVIKCDQDPSGGPWPSPVNLRPTTVADSLAAATGRRARVVAMSWKSRSAVLLGGRHPRAAIWFDHKTGTFTTSAYYGTLPAWAARANRERRALRQVGTEWRPATPKATLLRLGGPDEAPGEGDFLGLGRTFPHPIQSAAALSATPEANDLLEQLAEEAAAAEQLGRDDVPDLLAISFSATDFVGHVFGPDSEEAVDTLFRLDRDLARLLGWLDAHVGKGRYTVVLTSDHGGTSLPERTGGRRMPPDEDIAKAVEQAVGGGWKAGFVHPHLYLEPPDEGARAHWPAVVKKARAALLHMKGVERVLGPDDLAPPRDEIAELVYRTWDPERAGDLYVILGPNDIFEEDLVVGQGTGHGSPREYDRDVPLVFFGAGVRRSPERGLGASPQRRIVPQEAIVATVATLLGVPVPPAAAEGPLREVLLDR